jgi:WD40 repeat protein
MMIFDACERGITAIGFSPDGESLWTAGKDGSFRAWTLPDLGYEIPTKGREVTCFAFSADGQQLAFATADQSLYVHRIADRSFQPFPRQPADITGLGFLQKDELLVVGLGSRTETVSVNQPVRFYRIATKVPSSFGGQPMSGVRALDLHPSNRLVAWVNSNRQMFVREPSKPKWLFEKQLRFDPRTVRLSPDGRRIAVGLDWKCELYSIQHPAEPVICSGHKGLVVGLAFRPNGQELLTASWDQTVKIWDVESGQERASFDWQIGRLVAIAIAPDGLRAAAGSETGQVVVWDLD